MRRRERYWLEREQERERERERKEERDGEEEKEAAGEEVQILGTHSKVWVHLIQIERTYSEEEPALGREVKRR